MLPSIGRGNRAISVVPLHFTLPEPSRASISCLPSPFYIAGMKNRVESYQLKFHLVIDVARPVDPSLNISGGGQVSDLASQCIIKEF
jgi:hypothetical protein